MRIKELSPSCTICKRVKIRWKVWKIVIPVRIRNSGSIFYFKRRCALTWLEESFANLNIYFYAGDLIWIRKTTNGLIHILVEVSAFGVETVILWGLYPMGHICMFPVFSNLYFRNYTPIFMNFVFISYQDDSIKPVLLLEVGFP